MQYLKKMQLHSIAFSLLALVAILFSWRVTPINQPVLLMILVTLITVLGVPHGALDTLFAQQHWQLSSAKNWIIFLIAYSLLAVLTVGLWLWMPMLFFVGFIVISIIHFADDLPTGITFTSKIIYGGAIIVLPALLHQQQITQLFTYFIATKNANYLANSLHLLAFIWAAGAVISGFACLKANKYASLEILSVSLLALLASPLIAFTIYFCAMHSMRHLLRSHLYLYTTTKTLKFAALILPTLFVFIAALMCWPSLQNQAIDIKLIQLLFVTLAALTVPHMLLLYLSGFTSWIKT